MSRPFFLDAYDKGHIPMSPADNDPSLKDFLTSIAILFTQNRSNIAAAGLKYTQEDIGIRYPTIVLAANYGLGSQTTDYLPIFQRFLSGDLDEKETLRRMLAYDRRRIQSDF